MVAKGWPEGCNLAVCIKAGVEGLTKGKTYGVTPTFDYGSWWLDLTDDHGAHTGWVPEFFSPSTTWRVTYQ